MTKRDFQAAEYRAEAASLDPESCGLGCIRCVRAHDAVSCMFPIERTRMIVCRICGNKRCPHATDHRNVCTGSNERGQLGSEY